MRRNGWPDDPGIRIGVDADSGVTHSLETSTARLHGARVWVALLHGEETAVWAGLPLERHWSGRQWRRLCQCRARGRIHGAGQGLGCSSLQTIPRGLLKKSGFRFHRSSGLGVFGVAAVPDADQEKQQGFGEPLQVDGGGGHQGLDFHVGQPPAHGPVQSVEGFGQTVDAFDQPAVAGCTARGLRRTKRGVCAGRAG